VASDWDNAAQARRDFATLIEGLSEEQLASPSLCEGWSARDVAGHVVSFIEMSLPTLMFSMAKGGFDPDKAWKANAANGKLVSGPAEAILMGINRRDTRSELTGDGLVALPIT